MIKLKNTERWPTDLSYKGKRNPHSFILHYTLPYVRRSMICSFPEHSEFNKMAWLFLRSEVIGMIIQEYSSIKTCRNLWNWGYLWIPWTSSGISHFIIAVTQSESMNVSSREAMKFKKEIEVMWGSFYHSVTFAWEGGVWQLLTMFAYNFKMMINVSWTVSYLCILTPGLRATICSASQLC